MRTPVAFLALLCACEPTVGPAGPAGERGPQGEAGSAADVSALVSQIGQLKADVETLKATKTGKVPHLVVAETGEDIGIPTLGGCYWDAKAGGEICASPGQRLTYYSDAGCASQPYLLQQPERVSMLTTLRGDLYRVEGAARPVSLVAEWSNDKCIPFDAPETLDVFPIGKTGAVAAVYRPGTTMIELR